VLAEDIASSAGKGLLAAPAGVLHEVLSDQSRNAGAALGVALGLGRQLLRPARPALLVMQLGREIGDTGLPYGPGLKSFGIDPDAVVLTRTATITELLWAVEEAVACRAVAAVIADIAGHHKALDFTVSRRLSLRAAASGCSVLLVRYGREREASAARLRWRVLPEPGWSAPYDPRAPGLPRWRANLEKGRLGNGADGKDFLVDWSENGFVLVEHERREGTAIPRASPLSGARPAPLGHRLSEAV
jgi:protein ImuA